MKETRRILMTDYNKAGEYLEVVEVDSDKHDELLKERDFIRNEMIKLDSIEMEAKIKQAEIEAEDKREKIRNCITIGTFTVTSMISIWAVLKTFRFDQHDTVTSTLGRGILNGIIPKFKR